MPASKGKAVSKKSSHRKSKAKFGMTVAGGVVKFFGRPAFMSRAKALRVNQNEKKGLVQDRRHINHYDETLKPYTERVIGALLSKHKSMKVVSGLIRDRLERSGSKRIPRSEEAICLRLLNELNSSPANLVPDRADTNKAIELVRADLRKLTTAISTDQFAEDARSGNAARMNAYIAKAQVILDAGSAQTDISTERARMYEMIIGDLKGCQSPAQLWSLIHEYQYNATFDYSPSMKAKAMRKALAWEDRMRRNEGSEPEQQLDDLMSLC